MSSRPITIDLLHPTVVRAFTNWGYICFFGSMAALITLLFFAISQVKQVDEMRQVSRLVAGVQEPAEVGAPNGNDVVAHAPEEPKPLFMYSNDQLGFKIEYSEDGMFGGEERESDMNKQDLALVMQMIQAMGARNPPFSITLKEAEVQLPEYQPPVIKFEPQIIINVPEQPAPIVNVAPAEVTVNVEPTPVVIQVPEQPAPVKPKRERQRVIRDRAGNISATETEIEYE